MKTTAWAAAAVLALIVPTQALACMPSLMTPAEMRAETLSWHRAYWSSAATVRIAELTSITETPTEPIDPTRPIRVGEPMTVRITLTPLLTLKGEGSGEPIVLSFESDRDPPCNAPLWRDHRNEPWLGAQYVVYLDFTTQQTEEVKTVLGADLKDSATRAAWGRARAGAGLAADRN